MKKKLIAILVSVVLVSACGTASQIGSSISGRPTEYRFDDGVRCYYSQTGSLSCLVVK